MAERFHKSWLEFWKKARTHVKEGRSFSQTSQHTVELIDKLIDIPEEDFNKMLSEFSHEHRAGTDNSQLYVSSDEILDALGAELEEIAHDTLFDRLRYFLFGRKKEYEALSIGTGSLKDLFKHVGWLSNTLLLLKEVFDLFKVKKS